MLLLLLAVVALVIAKWDRAADVRSKVQDFGHKVLGNSAAYAAFEPVGRLLNDRARKVLDNNTTYAVLVTASNGQKDHLFVGVGMSDESPQEALTKAQQQLPRRTNAYPYIKIDVVIDVQAMTAVNYFEELQESFDYYGIALDWAAGLVFTPEEVAANALVDSNGLLRWEHIALYASRSKGRRSKLSVVPDATDDATVLEELVLFETESVFLDFANDRILPLYHGHRTIPEQLTSQLLKEAAREAGHYLGLSVHSDGRMVYKYKPRSDIEPLGYHLVRHAGTVYSMAKLYKKLHVDNAASSTNTKSNTITVGNKITNIQWGSSADPSDKELLKESLDLSTKYLNGNVVDCPIPLHPEGKERGKCLLDYEAHGHRMSKLGANAITLLALLEYMEVTGTTEYLSTVLGLAKYLTGSQRQDGSFVHKIYLGFQSTGDPLELERRDDEYYVRYYTGEVVFALTKLWRYNQRWKASSATVAQGWLDVSVKGVNYIVDTDRKQDSDAKFVFDHWLLYGIAEYYHARQDVPSEWIDHAKRSLQVARKFQTTQSDDPEENGFYYDDTSSTATATTTEGLCAIYPLLEESEHQDDLVNSVTLAVRFQLQSQYRPELAMHMREPNRIEGAFRSSLDGYDVRNDFTQHNACSILCLADVLEERSNHKNKAFAR